MGDRDRLKTSLAGAFTRGSTEATGTEGGLKAGLRMRGVPLTKPLTLDREIVRSRHESPDHVLYLDLAGTHSAAHAQHVG